MIFLVTIWVVKYIEIKFGLSFAHFGILPMELSGLKGILAAPLIHGDLQHLYHNSVPFVILSLGVIYFYGEVSDKILLYSYLGTGILVWFFGRPSFHIGASGVVYALASFVFFSGLIRRHAQLIAVSLLVVFLYGGMVWGVLPVSAEISWESHLLGAIMGLILAVVYRKMGPQRKKYDWELEEEEALNLSQEAEYWQPSVKINYQYKPKEHKDETKG